MRKTGCARRNRHDIVTPDLHDTPMIYQRYAIYVTLPEGPLADFGARWLGWDSVRGAECPHPALSGLPRPVCDLTERPRKYGLHGTIKPPFFLAEGQSQTDLQRSFETLCADVQPLMLPPLTLARIGPFLALIIDGDQTPLAALAARVVQDLDMYRAPPTDAELSRRNRSKLSAAQAALLDRWGYPYVMDQFKFHITLTGPLSDKDRDATFAVLQGALDPLLEDSFAVPHLTLLGSDKTGRFHEISRIALGRPS